MHPFDLLKLDLENARASDPDFPAIRAKISHRVRYWQQRREARSGFPKIDAWRNWRVLTTLTKSNPSDSDLGDQLSRYVRSKYQDVSGLVTVFAEVGNFNRDRAKFIADSANVSEGFVLHTCDFFGQRVISSNTKSAESLDRKKQGASVRDLIECMNIACVEDLSEFFGTEIKIQNKNIIKCIEEKYTTLPQTNELSASAKVVLCDLTKTVVDQKEIHLIDLEYRLRASPRLNQIATVARLEGKLARGAIEKAYESGFLERTKSPQSLDVLASAFSAYGIEGEIPTLEKVQPPEPEPDNLREISISERWSEFLDLVFDFLISVFVFPLPQNGRQWFRLRIHRSARIRERILLFALAPLTAPFFWLWYWGRNFFSFLSHKLSSEFPNLATRMRSLIQGRARRVVLGCVLVLVAGYGILQITNWSIFEPSNRAPVARGKIQDIRIEAGKNLSYSLMPYFRDPDGDSLRLQGNGPKWLKSRGLKLYGQPTNKDHGTSVVRVRASDGKFTSKLLSFKIRVFRSSNRPPIASGKIGNLQAVIGKDFSLSLSPLFRDPDGDSLKLRVTGPNWLRSRGLTLYGRPTARDVGTSIIQVNAFDGKLASARLSFEIQVLEAANRPPIAAGRIGIVRAETGQGFSLDLSRYFRDPDGGSLELQASGPNWLKARGLKLYGQPTNKDRGTSVVRVRASDGKLVSAWLSFNIQVLGPKNRPPVWSGWPNRNWTVQSTIGENFSINLSPYFHDPDGGQLNLSVKGPSWVKSRGMTLYGRPTRKDVGTRHVQVQAVDEKLATSKWLALNIQVLGSKSQLTNRAPIPKKVIDDKFITEGETIRLALSNSFIDPDGDQIKMYLAAHPPWIRLENEALVGAPPNGAAGDYLVLVGGSDGRLKSKKLLGFNIKVLAAGKKRGQPKTPLSSSKISGIWTGRYRCRQGWAGLELTIRDEAGNRISAEFSFFALPENPSVRSGRFRMHGVFDTSSNRLRLKGGEWIKRPNGYYAVNLAGSLDPNTGKLHGRVSPGCRTFEVTRKSAAAPLKGDRSGG